MTSLGPRAARLPAGGLARCRVAFVVGLMWGPLVVLAGGCGGGQARVAGRVTLDGRPLETGTVRFHPAAGGPDAYGSIDAQGRFTLEVGTSGRLPPGRYAAAVVAVAAAVAGDESRGEAMPEPITPARYADVATSGLAFDVASGANTIDIDLSSGGP